MNTCYTVILGGYDTLHNPTYITPGWNYVCLTDSPEICEGTVYQPLKIEKSRFPEYRAKVLKWSQWKYFSKDGLKIYHDGNFQVIGDLNIYIKDYLQHGFSTRKHPSRDNVWPELFACLEQNKGPKKKLTEYVAANYQHLSEQEPNELYENGLLIFSWGNLPTIESICDEIIKDLTLCNRDQLILPGTLYDSQAPGGVSVAPGIISDESAKATFNYLKVHK